MRKPRLVGDMADCCELAKVGRGGTAQDVTHIVEQQGPATGAVGATGAAPPGVHAYLIRAREIGGPGRLASTRLA